MITMTISYSLAPVPKWYIADLVGRPLAGGYMATFSNLNHTQVNPVYQDAAGDFVWPYVTIPNVGSLGILFDENGSQGPFYFKFDSLTTDALYYLEIYDSNGVLQWTIDDFSPPSGSGGSVVTTALDLENLIVNNVFWRNIGASSTPIGTTFLKLAPAANTGLVQTSSNAGPDICFIKNNSTATDSLAFTSFTVGDTPFTGDVTPVDYLNYTCTLAGTSETQKCVQFPITQGVQNLSNQNVIATIWARGTAGTTNLTLYWFQFFGNGAGASASVITPIQTLTLTSSWQKFSVTDIIPDVVGKNLGGCRNDGLFLQVQYPLGATCNIDFTKPAVYLGNISPDEDYRTYDMINAVIDSPRTGDYKTSINSFSPYGWVPMNDGTIGNPSSNANNRANFDTFPLFNFLWAISSTYAPLYTSAGVAQSRGATSIADFTANYQISLTNMLGRVVTGTANVNQSPQTFTTNHGVSATNLTVTNSLYYTPGTPLQVANSGGALPTGFSTTTVYYPIIISATVIQLAIDPYSSTPVTFSADGTGTNTVVARAQILGLAAGNTTHIMTQNELVPHIHEFGPSAFRGGTAGNQFMSSDASGTGTTLAARATTSTGNGDPFSIIQPSVYQYVYMKL